MHSHIHTRTHKQVRGFHSNKVILHVCRVRVSILHLVHKMLKTEGSLIQFAKRRPEWELRGLHEVQSVVFLFPFPFPCPFSGFE
jgi:hypothetical protein